ncbi:hypothetical protein MTO96_026292, partial [Rhipicephalus appendiculatus]
MTRQGKARMAEDEAAYHDSRRAADGERNREGRYDSGYVSRETATKRQRRAEQDYPR